MSRTLNTLLLVSALNVLLAHLVVYGATWGYIKPHGPNTWPKTFPQCAGKRQSPINIISKDAAFDGSINDLDIRSTASIDLNLTNNGHAITAKVFPSNDVMNFTGAGLKSRFVLDQFHFHVGSDSSKGSEHQISGKNFPLEAHFVYYDVKKPPSIAAAVMSVLFVEGDANPTLYKIVNNLQNCSYKGQIVQVGAFPVKDLLPKDTTKFYRYSGSFTTPQCNESVEWIVFHETVSVSKDQLRKLRNVYASSQQDTKGSVLLVNNFRPVQALNGRIVRKNFDHLKFLCAKRSNTTADCRQTVEGHDVFYEVEVNPCTLPVSVNLKMSVPDLAINVYKTIIEDLKTPLAIQNLKIGATAEMHFHSDGSKAGQLHVTVYQVALSQVLNKTKVIDNYFQVEGVCQRGNCSVDGWDNHWCKSTIGYSSKPLLIGFSSYLENACGTPSVNLEVYRNEIIGRAWVLTAKKVFKNKQSYLVNLTQSMVGGRRDQKSKRDAAKTPALSAVTLEAHIERTSDENSIFEIYVVTPNNGGHYLVFSTQYVYPSGQCSKSKSDGHGKKIAVGISIVVVMIIIIGLSVFLLYRNRRAYFGHRPALIDEIEVHDSDRL